MTELLDMIRQEPVAALFGACGLACQLFWPLMRSRTGLLTFQFGIGASYGIQYLLMGASSGATVCFVGAAQSLVAHFAGGRPCARFLGLAFLPVVTAFVFTNWDGLSSSLALASCCLVMLGRLQTNMIVLRIFLLAAAPFGIGYDIVVGAAPALIGGLTSAGLAITMLVRELRGRRDESELAYFAAAGMLV